MRALGISITLILASVSASAQQQAERQPVKTFASAADVEALVAKAASERKDGQPLVTERILQLAPYNANLEYRLSVGPAAIHETQAELFYVIEGAATMVTGGKLVNPARTNAENLTGSAIEGGVSRNVAKGDFIVVPENTPHWFSAIDGKIVLMSLHVPRTAAATR